MIDPYIQPRPEVIAALGQLASGGASLDARANAARALGILRGRQALPDLEQALRSKDSDVIYEALVAIEKIRDPSAGPAIAFLLHDLNEKVQVTAIEATGLLVEPRRHQRSARRSGSFPQYESEARRAHRHGADARSASCTASMSTYLDHKDEGLREGAAEGLGRLKNPADTATLERAFNNESKTEPRLSAAFALVNLGKRGHGRIRSAALSGERSEFHRLSRRRQGIFDGAGARSASPPGALSGAQGAAATKDEKTGLAEVLAASGGEDAVAPLQALSQDSDTEVSQEGLRAVKNLRAHLP